MSYQFLLPVTPVVVVWLLLPLFLRVSDSQGRGATEDVSELFRRLRPLSEVGVAEVASDFLSPSPEQVDPRSDLRLEPRDIWDLVGGVEGIEVMGRNAGVLVDLALHAQQGNAEALVVAERLRLDAEEIGRYLSLLLKSVRKGKLDHRIPLLMERVTAAYYLMTERLIVLYQVSHAGLVPKLKAALRYGSRVK